MSNLFHEILYRPLFNALIFLYQHLSFGDLGIAIILLTIVIRIILFPLFYKGAKDQAIMQRLAPRIKEIQNNHRDDRQKQAQALIDLYRQHKVNPFSGFLLLLIQLPILIALYRVFLRGFSAETLNNLYSFIPPPKFLSHFFLGIIDLSQKNIFVAVAAAATQYLQAQLSLPKTSKNSRQLTPAEKMGRQMVYISPILTIIFLYLFNLPSAVGLYWLTTSTFSVIQQIIINKKISGNFNGTITGKIKKDD